MKRRTILSFLLIVLSGGIGFADTGQTVTVNGAQINKFVTNLTFSGDNVTLVFDDSSSQAEDMSLVNIALTYGATGIENVEASERKTDGRVYSISGQYVGNTTDGLGKGVYIVNGKKIVIK